MPIDMTSPRASAEAALLGNECTFLRPRLQDNGKGGTRPHPDGPQRIGPFPCGFKAASGREAVSAEQLKQQGSYRLKLPTQLTIPNTNDPFVPADTDQVEVLGGVYSVVWTPPPSALSLFRKVGLELH
ncbi:MAG TPA: hypothetical protein VFU22_02600 [Roseiflexaceae bacterium]|nr:hypothetical protein [Roseiflexaceae bacterium]